LKSEPKPLFALWPMPRASPAAARAFRPTIWHLRLRCRRLEAPGR
jgi:hypothetical protein